VIAGNLHGTDRAGGEKGRRLRGILTGRLPAWKMHREVKGKKTIRCWSGPEGLGVPKPGSMQTKKKWETLTPGRVKKGWIA